MILEWDPEFPPELKSALEPLVEKWTWILPPWVHELVLRYKSEGKVTASTHGYYKYRWQKVEFDTAFIMEEPIARERSVIHEFLHICFREQHDALDILLNHVPEETKSLANDFLIAATEGVVQDLAEKLREKLT